MSYNLKMDLRVTLAVQMWTGLCYPPGEEQVFPGIRENQGPFIGNYLGSLGATEEMMAVLRLRETITHAIAKTHSYTAPVPRDKWTQNPQEIAHEHGIDYMAPDSDQTVILVSNCYLRIENVEQYKAEMDRKIDDLRVARNEVQSLFGSHTQSRIINLCSISYRFENDEQGVLPGPPPVVTVMRCPSCGNEPVECMSCGSRGGCAHDRSGVPPDECAGCRVPYEEVVVPVITEND